MSSWNLDLAKLSLENCCLTYCWHCLCDADLSINAWLHHQFQNGKIVSKPRSILSKHSPEQGHHSSGSPKQHKACAHSAWPAALSLHCVLIVFMSYVQNLDIDHTLRVLVSCNWVHDLPVSKLHSQRSIFLSLQPDPPFSIGPPVALPPVFAPVASICSLGSLLLRSSYWRTQNVNFKSSWNLFGLSRPQVQSFAGIQLPTPTNCLRNYRRIF